MEYEILNENKVPAYLAGRAELAERIDAATVSVREVGDGNLNLVFICTDAAQRSLVLKQSLPYVRVAGPSWELTAERSKYEAIGLREAHEASPDTAAEIYAYDEPQHVVAMEFLSDMVVWRTHLLDGGIALGADEACGRHIARLGFATSVHGRAAQEFRRARAASANPELSEITEDLVFTEPYIDHEHNEFDDAVAVHLQALRDDEHCRRVVSRLKLGFQTSNEALLHGDLHTGSIMVANAGGDEPTGIKVFDTEFGTYGPVAFDLGMLMANGLFAQARAMVLDRESQLVWLEGFAERIWLAYAAELRSLWPTRVDRGFGDDVLEDWLVRTEADAVGFAACEVVRRLVGFAKVADIDALSVEDRVVATQRLRIWLWPRIVGRSKPDRCRGLIVWRNITS